MDSTQNIQHNRKFKDFSWWYCIVYTCRLLLQLRYLAWVLGARVKNPTAWSVVTSLAWSRKPLKGSCWPLLTSSTPTPTPGPTPGLDTCTIKTHGIPQPQGIKYIIFWKAFSLIFFCFTIFSTPFFGSIHSTWANYEQDNMVLLNFLFECFQLQRLTFTCQLSDTE